MMQWLLRAAFRQVADSPEPLPDGVTLRYAKWLPAFAGVLSRMHGPAAAITFGRTIVVHPRVQVTSRLIRHELAHVRQWEENPLFPLHYLMNHLRYGYEQNPYEVEARAAERSP
jgi:hypothetical protein